MCTKTSRIAYLVIVFATSVGACKTRTAGNLSGYTCDARSGFCTPRNSGDGAAPSDGKSVDGDAAGDAVSPSPADALADRIDGAVDADGSADVGNGTIFIVSPVGTIYANGTVAIQVGFGAGSTTPDTVDILENGQQPPIGTMHAPYSFSWDTTTVPEGAYTITAQAQIAGQAVTSSPITVVVDRTKPTIAARTPAPNDTDIDLSNPIVIQFSEALLPSAVTAQTVTLAAGAAPVPSKAMLSADGKTITVALTMRRALALPATLTLTLAGSITDLAGNALAVAPWSWTVPLWLKYGSLTGSSPNIVLDSQGRLLISNVSERGAIGSGDFLVNVGRHQTGTSWDTTFGTPQGAQGLSFVPGPGAIVPGTDDNPIVAWPQFDSGNPPATIHVAKWTGTTWSQTYGQLDAEPGAGNGGYAPRLAVGPAGQFFLAWTENSQAYVSSVYVARWTGTSWDLSYGGIARIGASSPALRVTAAALPIVSWSSSIDGGGLSRWTGTTWATKTFGNSQYGQVALALDAAARPLVTSTDTNGGQLSVYRYNVDSDSVTIVAAPIVTATSPTSARLAVDPSGQILIAWTDDDGTTRNLHLARFDGTSWDTSFGTISAIDGPNTPAAHPDLVVTADGFPIIAWDEVGGQVQRPNTFVWKSNH